MTLQQCIGVCLLLLVVATADRPRLSVPPTWVVNYPEEAFNLVCTGSQKLSWEVPHVPAEYYKIENSEDSGKFVSVLQIASPQASDTGHFTCLYSSGQNASTYVYVYGGNETFVLYPEDHVVDAEIGSTFTLDCRTTHPDITVSVFRNQQIKFWSDLENVTAEFDKDEYGRFSKVARSLQDGGRYVCEEDRFQTHLVIILNVLTPPSPLHTPSIKEYTNSYHVLGLPISLNCSVPSAESPIQLNWTLPNPNAVYEVTQIEVEYMTTVVVSELIIPSATLEDSGTYTCVASKRAQMKEATQEIQIKDHIESFVTIDEPPKVLPISQGQNFQWIITVAVYPRDPKIIFYNPIGKILNNNKRVTITFDYPTGQLCLKIRNVQAQDFGRYTVNVTTSDGVSTDAKSVVMYVMAKPDVIFEEPFQNIVLYGDHLEMTAEVLSFDKKATSPDVTWSFIPTCLSFEEFCDSDVLIIESTERSAGVPKNRWFSDISFQPQSSGDLLCTVTNEFGTVEKSKQILVSDFEEPFAMELTSEHGSGTVYSGEVLELVEGDDIQVRCTALKFIYSNIELSSTESIPTFDCSTELSFASCIEISELDRGAFHTFSCQVKDRNTDEVTKTYFEVATINKSAPVLIENMSSVTEEGTRLSIQLGDSVDLSCVVDGQPKPNITWLLNEQNIEEIPDFLDNEAVELSPKKERLSFKFVKRNNEGTYTCLAQNREGKIQPYTEVNVKGKTLGSTAVVFISLAAAVIVVLVLVVGCLMCRVKKERKFRNALRKNQLYLFEKGNVGDLNQDCMLDEQAELLPYDNSYEIDRERISIGKQLGCGAFGRVMLADLRATSTDVREGKLALKMGKDVTDQSHLRALTAELKIMIHLGKHLNIVNLIGANTARLDKGEMWILVEYCKYGNLLRFIQKHKKSFVNTIDPETGIIDFHRTPSVGSGPLTPGGISYRSSSSGDHERLSPGFKLVNPHMFKKAPHMRQDSRSSDTSTLRPGFYAGNPHYAQMTSVQNTDENFGNISPEAIPGVGDNSLEATSPGKRHGSTGSERSGGSAETGYLKTCGTDITFLSSPLASHAGLDDTQSSPIHWESEVPGVNGHFSTAVLVCWAWQVACGMEYLAKRKVLHGDLAARNLLLATNNVVKISDFGLSKDIYKNDIYTKKDDGAMPIKWMSLEAIEQRLFSTQSDVWAYGVTLWELFTLGNTPYPGIAVDRDFVTQLEKGMRMSKPKYSNQELHNLMLQCWEEDPTNRPSFQSITNVLAELLYPETKEQYVAMNDVLVDSNKEWFETRPDYFNLLQTPDYSNLQPSLDANYLKAVNGHVLPVAEDGTPITPVVNGYLPMHTFKKSVSQENTDQSSPQPVPNAFFPESPQKPTEESDHVQNALVTPGNNNSIKFKEFQEEDGLLGPPEDLPPPGYVNHSEVAPPYVQVGFS